MHTEFFKCDNVLVTFIELYLYIRENTGSQNNTDKSNILKSADEIM